MDIGLFKRDIKQADFVYQPKRTSLVSGAAQIHLKPKHVEGAGSILLLVDFTINIDDFLRAIISEGEMMPRIIVDCLIAEEPTRCQPTATYLDFALISTSAGAEDVQNILPTCGVGERDKDGM